MVINKFHPPAYIPTEQEHKIAYLKDSIEDFSDTVLYLYNSDYDIFEHLKNSAKIDMQRRIARYKKNYIPIWKSHIPYEEFKETHTQALNEEHCGDCTLQSASCSRCWSENLYEITSTATWCSSCEFQNSKYCDCKNAPKA